MEWTKLKEGYINTMEELKDIIEPLSEEDYKKLVDIANHHTDLYENNHSILSDIEWDKIYFMIRNYEKKNNIINTNSPTQSIRYNVVNELKKVQHAYPMKSLDKTKEITEILDVIKQEPTIIMSKLDGLSLELTYINGKLKTAVTRGRDGIIGEDVTHNAFVIPSIPKNIYNCIDEELVVAGEILCKTDTFEEFKKQGYKNPRNLASGSIRLLDPKECEQRKLTFYAWDVIKGLDMFKGNEINTLSEKLFLLQSLYNFNVAPYLIFDPSSVLEHGVFEYISTYINTIKEVSKIDEYIPIDGVVFKINNIDIYNSKGETEHHPKGAIAYKFTDEEYETELLDIEYTMGRSGNLTPIAIFEPIFIDGTVVSRANLHNISIMEDLLHGSGRKHQIIKVAKMNMIIPQVVWAEEDNHNTQIPIPHICPICGADTIIKREIDSKVLYCTNENCSGKIINILDHFCGKKGLDIKGLSKKTLEKLINWNYVSNIKDILLLKNFREDWIKKEGFGILSVDKILNAIEEKKKSISLIDFISALGIPLIGKSVVKEICTHVSTYQEFRKLIDDNFNFSEWDTFADSKTNSLLTFDYSLADSIINEKLISIEEIIHDDDIYEYLEGLTFVITGKLHSFKNRDELKAKIESLGGKVLNKVTYKVSYLINNDKNSTSIKNKTAKELGVKIITEDELRQKFDL